MKDHMWFIFLAALALGIILFFGGLAGAGEFQDRLRGIIQEEVGTRRRTRRKSHTLECRVSHYDYVWQGGKLVKVPVTICKEK